MLKVSKSVRVKENPTAQKQAIVKERGDGLYTLSPKWSFIKSDFEHSKWGLDQNTEYLPTMLMRFKEWEKVLWKDVLTPTSGRKSNTQSHPMAVNILSKEAAKRLSALHLDEYDTLYSLAITGKQRVWGIMIEDTGTFQVLWYDPLHEIYSVEK